jgi:uncharacterized membrane protein YbhN (UPF0104 family)
LLLGYIGQRVGSTRLVEQLRMLDPGWISIAIGLSVIQHVLSAFRWQLASAALEIRLGLRDAIAHYYASGLLNATLPSGIAGEGMRIWAQSKSSAGCVEPERSSGIKRAALAVASERAAGQVTLGLLAFVGAIACVTIYPATPRVVALAIAVVAINLLLVTVIAAATRLAYSRVSGRIRIPWFRLGVISLPITFSYVAVFACTLLALGLDVTPSVVMIAIPLTLLAMSIPISVGGFGPRETVALFLWGLLGHEPESGAIGALAYGLVCLAASLPGLIPIGMLLGRRKPG